MRGTSGGLVLQSLLSGQDWSSFSAWLWDQEQNKQAVACVTSFTGSWSQLLRHLHALPGWQPVGLPVGCCNRIACYYCFHKSPSVAPIATRVGDSAFPLYLFTSSHLFCMGCAIFLLQSNNWHYISAYRKQVWETRADLSKRYYWSVITCFCFFNVLVIIICNERE